MRMPPQLHIAHKGELVGLGGWDELDCYGNRNHPVWLKATQHARLAGLGEADRLKLLCAALLEDSLYFRSGLEALSRRLGIPT